MLDFLTEKYLSALSYVNINLLYELRLRAGKPAVINYKGQYNCLCERGTCLNASGAIMTDFSELEEIVFRASEYSVYSVTEQLKQGFITGKDGERIGIAGSFVYENGQTFTVKDITSLNIRIPHEIIGCGRDIYSFCLENELKNILILSSPGRGKTTILRDISRLLCENKLINILINDERNEIAASNKNFSLKVGNFCDIIKFSYKRDGLNAAVRSMRPDVIITDEISGAEDVAAVCDCARSGVNIVASAHLRDINSLKNASNFVPILRERVFDYYVVLDFAKIGKIYEIYDGKLNKLRGYCA